MSRDTFMTPTPISRAVVHISNVMRAGKKFHHSEGRNWFFHMRNLLRYATERMQFSLSQSWRAKFKASAGNICPAAGPYVVYACFRVSYIILMAVNEPFSLHFLT